VLHFSAVWTKRDERIETIRQWASFLFFFGIVAMIAFDVLGVLLGF